MLATHKGLNISATEFMAVLDDALIALQKNDIGQREQEEVLYVLYSMRSDVVLVQRYGNEESGAAKVCFWPEAAGQK